MNFMNSPNFGNSPPPPNSNSQSPQIPPIHNQFPSTPLIPQDTQLMNSFNYQPFSYPFFLNSSHPFIPNYYGGYGQNSMPRPFMVPSPSQQMEGNSEDASITGNEAPLNVTQQEKNSRHVKWSAEEEEMLISSWITKGSFWARVAGYFNTYRKTRIEKEESQIKSHYYLMMPQVNEFNGYYNQIVSDHHSGWSDNQIIEATRLIWKNAHKKREFPYTHVLEMVKDEPKWEAQIGAQNASKKTKTSESGAYTSSSNHDIEENTYEGNESESRPIGQKAAKRKMREKEKKDVTEEFAHRWKWRNFRLKN
uniref:No apical meristem-associated C-terminal domain-containing protein n=1 Tax=Kalanchoe fedtschenkoi TaxID=63787 RepID=A0A7N0ZTL9_KALFE